MFNILKNKNSRGINLFNILLISIGRNKGVLVDTISLVIKLYKIELGIFLGKEKKSGKKTKQKLKESTNNVASA